MEKYNGWANYETWAVKLWLDNEYGMEGYIKDLAENFECTSGYELGEVIKNEIIETRLEEMNLPASLFTDLLNASLSRADWTEIGEAFWEDLDLDEEENEDE
jgi:hypothetical protein